MAWKADPGAAQGGKRWTENYQPDGRTVSRHGIVARQAERGTRTRTAHGIGARATPPKKQRIAPGLAHSTEGDERAALVEAAQAEVATVLARCNTPITRPQWAAWLDEHLDEFHLRMKTAPARRRAGNIRWRAREGLPEPVKRMQPRRAPTQLTQQWATNLSGRTGWHGLKTVTEKKMLCLMCNGGDIYYIDLEPNREGPNVAYAFTRGSATTGAAPRP